MVYICKYTCQQSALVSTFYTPQPLQHHPHTTPTPPTHHPPTYHSPTPPPWNRYPLRVCHLKNSENCYVWCPSVHLSSWISDWLLSKNKARSGTRDYWGEFSDHVLYGDFGMYIPEYNCDKREGEYYNNPYYTMFSLLQPLRRWRLCNNVHTSLCFTLVHHRWLMP